MTSFKPILVSAIQAALGLVGNDTYHASIDLGDARLNAGLPFDLDRSLGYDIASIATHYLLLGDSFCAPSCYGV